MLRLRDPSDTAQIQDAVIRNFLEMRFRQLNQQGDYSPDVMGYFVLVEPGDHVEQLEAAEGVWIFTGLFSDACYGEPDFAPAHEVLESFPSFYEMAFVLGEGAVSFIVPKREDVDQQLIRYCQEYALPGSLLPAS